MFQEDVLFPRLTVYKNIAFGLEQTYKEKEKSFTLLKAQSARKEKQLSQLFIRWRKARVALARVLIKSPRHCHG